MTYEGIIGAFALLSWNHAPMRLVERFKERPHACAYLPDRLASLDVAMLVEVTAAELGILLESGWRRFGPSYFRPDCAACRECVSLRVPVAAFQPSRSQRRARRLARGLTRSVGVPVVDEERVELYRRWHAQRERARGWDVGSIDEERYSFDFAFAHPAVREVTFRDPAHSNRLVGLGIVDEVPSALSAVIFFWDPEFAPPSLGVAHVVCLIEDAATRNLAHVYLGYRVTDCASLAYKARYRPHELLVTPPGHGVPVWRAPDPGVDPGGE
jgi:arginyl-tRNA--protein-N-Asp/Glu arginylyltransferase